MRNSSHIDEYRLVITPDIFGGGKRLFEPGLPHLALTLIGSAPSIPARSSCTIAATAEEKTMALTLHSHPFSSYCQKVLIALYENGTPFTPVLLEGPEAMAELEKLWPLKRFPVLVDGGKSVIETSIIIEHLQLFHPGPVRLIPEDPAAALEARWLDRFFDNYVGTPQGRIVFNAIRPEEHRDPYGVAECRQILNRAYAWLDEVMADRQWATGEDFSLADCAAAPHLFYADWTHPIDPGFGHVHAYRQRLLARPSFARAVDEARKYRAYFPLGAPNRD